MKKNKILWVSGGTKGIGLAIVNKFAENNFDICFCSRNKKNVLQLENELKKNFPKQKFYGIPCDAGDKNQVKNFAEMALKNLSVPDVLVNNTGTFIPGSIYSEKENIFEEQIKTNVASAYYFTRSVIQKMMKKKSGYVFNICSTASFTPYINGGSYCISKFAMLGFSKVLREEMKPFNIRVTSLMPGATLTESWNGTSLPNTRFMQPEDVAEMIWVAYNLPDNVVVEELVMRPLAGDID